MPLQATESLSKVPTPDRPEIARDLNKTGTDRCPFCYCFPTRLTPSGESALWLQLCANFSAFVLGAVDIDVKVAVLEALELFVGEPGPGRNAPLAV